MLKCILLPRGLNMIWNLYYDENKMLIVKLLIYITLNILEKGSEMKLTTTLICLIGVLLSLPGALSSYCSVTEYSSPVSYYTKFTQQTTQSYNSWASVCTGQFLTRSPDTIRMFTNISLLHTENMITLFIKYFFSTFRLKLKLSKCYFFWNLFTISFC